MSSWCMRPVESALCLAEDTDPADADADILSARFVPIVGTDVDEDILTVAAL